MKYRPFNKYLVAANMLALLIASWTPGEEMIRTGVLSGRMEHLLAYGISGAFTFAMLAERCALAWIAIALVAYAGLLEFGQAFVPGRHAKLADFLFSAIGAVLGVIAGLSLRHLGLSVQGSRARSDD